MSMWLGDLAGSEVDGFDQELRQNLWAPRCRRVVGDAPDYTLLENRCAGNQTELTPTEDHGQSKPQK